MTDEQIQELLSSARLPEGQKVQKLVSTHISWVILAEKRVYKIKKPVKHSFLDFSTLALRKFYCEEELRLNQRLTSDVYLSVLPIRTHEGQWHIGGETGLIEDYALEMNRLDNSQEMDILLKEGAVTKEQVEQIAHLLADFHQNTDIIQGKVDSHSLWEDFKDLAAHRASLESELGSEAAVHLDESMRWVEEYLEANKALIAQRDNEGLLRDCHGDLHSGNIFLLEQPVLFDCIEFNPHFRQIDILSELAFFTMDLEFYDREDLSTCFMAAYLKQFDVMRNREEERLFLFYKLYRANVRLKVDLIKWEAGAKRAKTAADMDELEQYWKLYSNYLSALKKV